LIIKNKCLDKKQLCGHQFCKLCFNHFQQGFTQWLLRARQLDIEHRNKRHAQYTNLYFCFSLLERVVMPSILQYFSAKKFKKDVSWSTLKTGMNVKG